MLLVTLNHPLMAGCVRHGRIIWSRDKDSLVTLYKSGEYPPSDMPYTDIAGLFFDRKNNVTVRDFVAVYGDVNAAFVSVNTVENLKVGNGYLVGHLNNNVISGCLSQLGIEESAMQAALDVYSADTVNSK